MKNKKYMTGVALAVSVLACGGLLSAGTWTRAREMNRICMEQMTEEEEDKNKTILQRKKLTVDDETYLMKNDLTTYVILGTDNSDLNPVNTEGKEQGYVCKMADMILVLVVDEKEKTYRLLQLDRNTVTKVRQLYTNGEIAAELELQLCSAYYYGNEESTGAENTAKAVSDLLLNTPITRYVAIGMDQIGEINRIAGGVTVTLEDDFSAEDPAMKQGETLTLTDEQAKLFATGRMSVGDGSNEGRLRRQRTYIDGLKAALIEQVKADGKFVDKAYEQMQEIMVTNATEKELGSLAVMLSDFEDGGLYTLEGQTRMGEAFGDGAEHEEFYADEKALTETVLELFYEGGDRAGEYVRKAQEKDLQ